MRKILVGVLLGLGAAGVALAITSFGWLERTELLTYDWRTRRIVDAANADPSIVLVEVNDTTLRDLAPYFGRWPWPRAAFSMLLDYLHRGAPKVIAIDFTFAEPQSGTTFMLGNEKWSGEESDQAFVDSAKTAGNVIFLADVTYQGTVENDQINKPAQWRSLPYRLGPAIDQMPVVLPPFQALADAAHGFGHNFMPLDDGAARRQPPFIRSGEKYLPSLGIAAALDAAGIRPDEIVLDGRTLRIRERAIPLMPVTVRDTYDPSKSRQQLTMLIPYLTPALTPAGDRPFKSYEARYLFASEQQLLNGETPLVDPSVFKDKIVFVGQTISGLVDVFQTPVGRTMPGIQVHASVAQSILSGRFIERSGSLMRVTSTLAAATLVGVMSTLLPVTAAVVASFAAAGLLTWGSVEVFRHGVWIELSTPLLGMAVALLGGTAYRYFVEDSEKRLVKGLFGRYVSRDVFTQLMANPGLATLGGRRRAMTVLFSDIRGFTAITEKGDPEALVAQLNEYFTRMVDIVFRNHGTVDKFVGDMVMALFGAPVDDVDHAEHAARASVEMVAELRVLNAKWAAEGRARLDIGIGINSGEMIAGNIGSSSIMSYTVIGDNVNLGSRLESLNKEYRTRIIISDATRTRLKGPFETRPLGDVIVKGKSRPVSIFEIVVPSPLPEGHEDVNI